VGTVGHPDGAEAVGETETDEGIVLRHWGVEHSTFGRPNSESVRTVHVSLQPSYVVSQVAGKQAAHRRLVLVLVLVLARGETEEGVWTSVTAPFDSLNPYSSVSPSLASGLNRLSPFEFEREGVVEGAWFTPLFGRVAKRGRETRTPLYRW